MLKTKVMEWLHDWIVVSKRIVQKYTIEALNVDRNALKKKCRFSIFIIIMFCWDKPSIGTKTLEKDMKMFRKYI